MNSSRGFDPLKQIRSHRNRFFARFRFLLSLVLTIALVWLPSQGILVGSHAASSGQEPESGVQRVVGAPLPNLPNLDEARTQRPRPPVSLPPRPSTMRSKKSPLVPYDGRKVGDPLSVIRAPVPSVAPGPPPLDPQVPNNDELSKLKSDRRGRNTRAHHPLGRRALMRAAAPFTVTEDQYIQDFFLTALARQPSTAELNYWHDIFRSAYANSQSALVLAVQELGKTLFESADYAARDGGLRLSNTEPHPHDFVADLYHAYLRRAPDQPAWDAWATYATTPNGHENTRHGFESSSELYNLMGTFTVGGSASSSVNSLVSARVDPENQAGAGLLGRSVDWSTSLLSLPGRAGLDLGLTLSYSSQVWTRGLIG